MDTMAAMDESLAAAINLPQGNPHTNHTAVLPKAVAAAVLRRPSEDRTVLQSPVGTPTGMPGASLPLEAIQLTPVGKQDIKPALPKSVSVLRRESEDRSSEQSP